MKIAYLLPTALIDYPGKVAALTYTAGCNFRCPFYQQLQLNRSRVWGVYADRYRQ